MRDADGYFWFVGRADDVIKSSGHLIGPFEVESALMEHPAVAEAGVIGKPDPVQLETVKAFVSLKPIDPAARAGSPRGPKTRAASKAAARQCTAAPRSTFRRPARPSRRQRSGRKRQRVGWKSLTRATTGTWSRGPDSKAQARS